MSARLSREEARRLRMLAADLAVHDRDLARRLARSGPSLGVVGVAFLGLLGLPILLTGLAAGSGWFVAAGAVVIVLPGLVLTAVHLVVAGAGRRRYRRDDRTRATRPRFRGRSG